jgi:hypothetical protein
VDKDALVVVICESYAAYTAGATTAGEMAERICQAVRRHDGQRGGRPSHKANALQRKNPQRPETQILNEFCQVFQEVRGVPYTPSPADHLQLGYLAMAAKVGPLRPAFEAYFRDEDPFLSKVGYSLKFFALNGLNKYRLIAAGRSPSRGPMDAIVSENFRTKGYGA